MKNVSNGAYHHAAQVYSVYPALLQPVKAVFSDPEIRGKQLALRASSTIPGTIFVHVKCKMVSIP